MVLTIFLLNILKDVSFTVLYLYSSGFNDLIQIQDRADVTMFD